VSGLGLLIRGANCRPGSRVARELPPELVAGERVLAVNNGAGPIDRFGGWPRSYRKGTNDEAIDCP